MKAKERNKISSGIYWLMNKLGNSGWFKEIPITEIDQLIRSHGYRLVNEDLTDLSCLLCGREGHTVFQIAPINVDKFCKPGLALSWYKSDGKKTFPYDVVAYLT